MKDFLTHELLQKMCNDSQQIELTTKQQQSISDAHTELLDLVRQGQHIYGFNVGVGSQQSKSKTSVDITSEHFVNQSKSFNNEILHSTAISFDEYLPPIISKKVCIIRINEFINGNSGVQIELPQLLIDILKNDYIPAIPAIGSVGLGDIGQLAYLGLVLKGEGKAWKGNKLVDIQEYFKNQNKYSPHSFLYKDALGLISSNAVTLSLLDETLKELDTLRTKLYKLHPITLESFKGNISTLIPEQYKKLDQKSVHEVCNQMNISLTDSDLTNPNTPKNLQDPISIRTCPYHTILFTQYISELKGLLEIEMNHGNENPAFFKTDSFYNFYPNSVEGRFLIPTVNFENSHIILEVEKLQSCISRYSQLTKLKILKLIEERFSEAKNFLSIDGNDMGIRNISRLAVDLDHRIVSLNQKSTCLSSPIENSVEDLSLNSQLVINQLQDQVKLLYKLCSLEAFTATRLAYIQKEHRTYSKNLYKILDQNEFSVLESREISKFYDFFKESF